MSSIDKNGTVVGVNSSLLLPPLNTQTVESITKNIKAFSISKGERYTRARPLNKNQVLVEYFGCDSPPVGQYNPEIKTSIKSVPNVTEKRFRENNAITLLKKNIPIGYLNNFDTFSKSLNQSNSNLSKETRFKARNAYEKDLVNMPSPLDYNLSDSKSISKYATMDKTSKAKISPKKQKYDRFKSKAYFKELDRGVSILFVEFSLNCVMQTLFY